MNTFLNRFAMCLDRECPSRDRCHRHEESGTVPTAGQHYANFRRKPEETMCLHWWPKEAAPTEPCS